MLNEDHPVLIVGGGVVGLSASLFLARQGVPSVLVERHPGTSIHPRARGLNGRTMELMREVGLEEAVRQAGAGLAASVGLHRGESLVQVLAAKGEGGWWLRRVRRRGVKGQGSRRSPTGPCRCTQDQVEPLLLEAARARGVAAHFHTELVDFHQDDAAVTAELLDRGSGARRTLRARYLVAADGARSPVRTRLAVPQSGAGGLGHQLNLYFRADLAALVAGREFSMCLVEAPGLRGLLASINNRDLWVLHVSYDPERGESPGDFPPARCLALIRQAIGLPTLEVELKGALPWQSTVRVADRFQHGRIFLAGDAAHIMPPWGGFGANTGIQDAHNLAWKLAAVLHGQAGPALLETYDQERHPVGLAVATVAGQLNDPRGLMDLPRTAWGMLRTLWRMRQVFPYLTMGYGYSSPAVACEPGPAPGPGTTDLRGRPGTRAPHVWLARDGQRLSTLDLFGGNFVLLAGPRGQAWPAAAARLGVPIDAHVVGQTVQDPESRWPAAYRVKPDGAVLVRPDGIVAWRSPRASARPVEVLSAVLARLLDRAPATPPAIGVAQLATG